MAAAVVAVARKGIDPEMQSALVAAVPSLRAFATSLCVSRDRADDLVQDTLVKAIAAIDRFERGTNLGAWLFTILRNQFYSDFRSRARLVHDPEGLYAARLKSVPEQEPRLLFDELRDALTKLPPCQREALLLVGALGLSYEEAANIMGCAVGTVKSRVNRARTVLAELLEFRGIEDYGCDRVTKAALSDSS